MSDSRWTLGRMQNPFRGFIHGSAAVASVAATALLAAASPNWGIRTGALVFGLAFVGLYTVSSLYHTVPWRETWKRRMQRIDQTMILVVVAGTQTPIVIAVLDGWFRWGVLIAAWGIVAIGAAQHILFPREKQSFSMTLANVIGWLGLAFSWKFVQELGWTSAALVLIGGALYTVGMVFLIANRPRLWPRVFSYHEVFHIMVVTASAVHFVLIWKYVLPHAA